MTEHNPEFETTQKKIDLICDYIKQHLPGVDICIADKDFDKFIPDGLTFIFPRGAIAIGGYFPIFEYDYENNHMKVKVPELLFRIPELIFRINEDGTVIGMGNISKPFVDRLNKL